MWRSDSASSRSWESRPPGAPLWQQGVGQLGHQVVEGDPRVALRHGADAAPALLGLQIAVAGGGDRGVERARRISAARSPKLGL